MGKCSTFVVIGMLAILVAGTAAAGKFSPQGVQKDLVYATIDGKNLQYDIAKPADGSGPYPLIICLHAGGWQLGNKKSFDDEIRDWAGRGYVVAAINYRLTPSYKWPAQIEDVRGAVHFFRLHASENNIDPARIGVVGDDSGGHLALMEALLAAEEEKGLPLEQSSRVSAVANFFGPTDLREWRVTSAWVETKIRIGFMKSSEQIIEDFLGTRDRSALIYTEASPISHVTAGAPPILTVIGTKDPLITLDQPKSFHEALKKAGVPEELLIVPGAEHSRSSTNNGVKANDRMLDFFDKYLKKSENKS